LRTAGGGQLATTPFSPPLLLCSPAAYVCIRQHTSAYVRILPHTSAYVSIRPHTSAYVSIRPHTSAYVSIRQHTSAGLPPPPFLLRCRFAHLSLLHMNDLLYEIRLII
jgi:hypothetical protein